MTSSASRVADGFDPEPGTSSSQLLTVSAFAKINLTFEVLGTRPDGLHEVGTVMQTISLADRLRFTPARELSLRHRGLRPAGVDDLILRAALLFLDRTHDSGGCAIECSKCIPIAAGLGGGSADAAATLRGLDELRQVGLGATALGLLGAELGADVPFLIEGGTALGTGTGNELARLPDALAHWVVLVRMASGEALKTEEMYARLEPADFTDGTSAHRQAAAVASGHIDYQVVRSAFNRLAVERWPQTAEALHALIKAEAQAASVSGAGPSVFGLYDARASALRGMVGVRAAGLPARLCRFAPRVAVPSSGESG